MANLRNTFLESTGAIKLPSGSTNERPNEAELGYIRFNTDSKSVEFFNGQNWETYFYPTNFVRTGLIAHLDAQIPESYPESGDTWFDLSGNSNNFSLINSPTFSTARTLIFNGIDQSANLSSTLISTGYYTITIVLKILDFSGNRKGFAGNNNYIEFGYLSVSNHGYYTTQESLLDLGDNVYTENKWHVITLTNTDTYASSNDVRQVLYVDGNEVSNIPTNSSVGSQAYDFNIAGGGIWDAGGNHTNLEIKSCLVYNRGLTQAEVIKNHTYFKQQGFF